MLMNCDQGVAPVTICLHVVCLRHALQHGCGFNGRCCCNETPSTAGQNQDYFYPHFIQKLFSKNCHAIYTPSTLNAIQFAQLAINTRVSHSIRLLEMRTFPTEKQLCWFQYSAGKIIKISSCHWWRFLTATSAIVTTFWQMEWIKSQMSNLTTVSGRLELTFNA